MRAVSTPGARRLAPHWLTSLALGGLGVSGPRVAKREEAAWPQPSEPLLRLTLRLPSRELRHASSMDTGNLPPGILRFLYFSGAGKGFNIFCVDTLDF